MHKGSGVLVPMFHLEEEIDFMSPLKRAYVLMVYVCVSYHIVSL